MLILLPDCAVNHLVFTSQICDNLVWKFVFWDILCVYMMVSGDFPRMWLIKDRKEVRKIE